METLVSVPLYKCLSSTVELPAATAPIHLESYTPGGPPYLQQQNHKLPNGGAESRETCRNDALPTQLVDGVKCGAYYAATPS